MEEIEPLKKYGKPYLIPFYCTYKGEKCFGKLFYIINEDVKKKYETEVKTYKDTISGLLAITPHLPKIVKVYKSYDGVAFYKKHKSELSPKHVKLLGENYKLPTRIILYEFVGNTTLRTNINRILRSDLEKVFFQLFFTIICFQAKGVCHRDLYIQGNIMIRKLRTPKDLHYKVGKRYYTLPNTKWFASIIDFDIASNDVDDECHDFEILVQSIREFYKKNDNIDEDNAREALEAFGESFRVKKRDVHGEHVYEI